MKFKDVDEGKKYTIRLGINNEKVVLIKDGLPWLDNKNRWLDVGVQCLVNSEFEPYIEYMDIKEAFKWMMEDPLHNRCMFNGAGPYVMEWDILLREKTNDIVGITYRMLADKRWYKC